MNNFSYKSSKPFNKRLEESTLIMTKYPGRYPFIIERSSSSRSSISHCPKTKFLVPGDITVGQMLAIVRRNITLPPEIAIFLFCNNTLPASNTLMRELYHANKEPDGFTYITYTGESTFGARPLHVIKLSNNFLSCT